VCRANELDLTSMLGTYRTPSVRIGQIVRCEVRGLLRVVELRDSPIQWPLGRAGKGPASPIVYRGLAKAIRVEAVVDICQAWGVSPSLVQRWRKVLGVKKSPGTTVRRQSMMRGLKGQKIRKAALPALSSPERRAKIAAAQRAAWKRGRPSRWDKIK
jgi:hypothetical protein